MKKVNLTFLALMYLIPYNSILGISPDSANRFISIHLNKRILHSYDLNQQSIYGPFKNNHIYSIAIVAQKTIFTYHKIDLNAHTGLTGQILRIGEIDADLHGRHMHENINCNSLMLSFNAGLSIEKNILKFKNNRLAFGIGIWTTGIFYNTIKTKTIVQERNDFLGRDSIVISFTKNNLFYINPFYQLTLKTKLKHKTMLCGLRLLFPFNEVDTKIDYNFFVTFIPGYTGYRGGFADDTPRLVCFFGISF